MFSYLFTNIYSDYSLKTVLVRGMKMTSNYIPPFQRSATPKGKNWLPLRAIFFSLTLLMLNKICPVLAKSVHPDQLASE